MTGRGFKDDNNTKKSTPRVIVDTTLQDCLDDIQENEEEGSPSQTEDAMDKPPMCTHARPCIKLVVRKNSTGNKGREFWGCASGMKHQGGCGFFLWCDDYKPLALHVLRTMNTNGHFSKAMLSDKKKEWDKLTVADLRKRLVKRGVKVSGKKADILQATQELYHQDLQDTQALDDLEMEQVLETVFHHSEFLPGQQHAISKVLAGDSFLYVSPTGSGKSLCYQLPAFILKGVTLVVSPLVALMQDQLAHLPAGLPGAMLGGNQTATEKSKVIAGLKAGFYKVLFVAPRALLHGRVPEDAEKSAYLGPRSRVRRRGTLLELVVSQF